MFSFLQACVPNKSSSVIVPKEECWVHLYSSQSGADESLLFTPVHVTKKSPPADNHEDLSKYSCTSYISDSRIDPSFCLKTFATVDYNVLLIPVGRM
jgi:hypothetical protein